MKSYDRVHGAAPWTKAVGVRFKAATAIAYAEPAMAITLLRESLEDHHPRVRAAAVHGLVTVASRIPTEARAMIHEVLRSLTAALEDTHPKVAKIGFNKRRFEIRRVGEEPVMLADLPLACKTVLEAPDNTTSMANDKR
jgi:hypothetical protein